jgi:hypothetical protein
MILWLTRGCGGRRMPPAQPTAPYAIPLRDADSPIATPRADSSPIPTIVATADTPRAVRRTRLREGASLWRDVRLPFSGPAVSPCWCCAWPAVAARRYGPHRPQPPLGPPPRALSWCAAGSRPQSGTTCLARCPYAKRVMAGRNGGPVAHVDLGEPLNIGYQTCNTLQTANLSNKPIWRQYHLAADVFPGVRTGDETPLENVRLTLSDEERTYEEVWGERIASVGPGRSGAGSDNRLHVRGPGACGEAGAAQNRHRTHGLGHELHLAQSPQCQPG